MKLVVIFSDIILEIQKQEQKQKQIFNFMKI